MSPTSFRKTILALAVTAALPTYAQSMVLTNAGIEENDKVYSDSVFITGSFTSSNSDINAIAFNSTVFEKDLILNTTINASGNNINGLNLGFPGNNELDLSNFSSQIQGNLVNKGKVSVAGQGSAGVLIDPAIIYGDFVNEGTISAKGGVLNGDGVRAVEFAWSNRLFDLLNAPINHDDEGARNSTLYGNLINNTSGKIIAEGVHSTGIRLGGSEIFGSLINHGLIQTIGESTTAIEYAPSYSRYGRDPIFGPGPLPNQGGRLQGLSATRLLN